MPFRRDRSDQNSKFVCCYGSCHFIILSCRQTDITKRNQIRRKQNSVRAVRSYRMKMSRLLANTERYGGKKGEEAAIITTRGKKLFFFFLPFFNFNLKTKKNMIMFFSPSQIFNSIKITFFLSSVAITFLQGY